MITYFGVYLSIFVLSSVHRQLSINLNKFIYVLVLLFLILFIGLRDQVGGDWNVYYDNLNDFKNSKFGISNLYSNIGYVLLLKFFSFFKLNIYIFNFFSAILLIFSFNFYIKNYEEKYFLILVTFLFLIIFIGMGFIRQGFAISFLFISLFFLEKNYVKISFLLFILAITFHLSIIILLPIYLISILSKKNIILAIFLTILSFFVFLVNIYEFINLFETYVSQKGVYYEEAKGVYFRYFITCICSVMFIYLNNQFVYKYNYIARNFYFYMSIYALLLFPLIFILPTILDRLNYFFIPIIIITLVNVINIFKNKYLKIYLENMILVIFFILLVTWFGFGTHSFAWVPYKII